MQSATTTLIQVGKGWNTGGVYRLQDTQSTSFKQISRLSCLSWSKPSSLFPTELTFSLALPLQSHHTFTTMLCLGFELEVPTHAGQATPAHTYLGLIPELGYAKSRKYWLNDRMAELFYWLYASGRHHLSAWMAYFRPRWSKQRRKIIESKKKQCTFP